MSAEGDLIVGVDPSLPKAERYQIVLDQIFAVLEGETDADVWMPTIVCILKQQFGFLWVGFYRADQDGLHVGPYQGSLGCLHIALGKGVCGAAAAERRTIVVKDVHAFAGHIACDSRSNSEIVIPVEDTSGTLRAVLDLDSEHYAHFDEVDRRYLEKLTGAMRDLRWTERP